MTAFLEILLWGTTILILAILFGAVGTISYVRWYRGTLEKSGFPVVKSHWLLGSNHDAHNRIQPLVDMERMKKYGHVYGVYDGRQPTIFISDTKLLKQIQITDFQYFSNHKDFLLNYEFEHPIFAELLDFLHGEKWKTVRSTLTPHFTTAKIAQSCLTISEIVLDYVTALKQEMDLEGSYEKKIEFKRYSSPMLLEIIGKVFCGINILNARDPENVFVKNMKQCLGGDGDVSMDWTFTLASVLPFINKFSPVFPRGALDVFEKTMIEILEARDKTSSVEQNDMVNTLLEMTRKAESDPNYKSLGITRNTALAQAFEFFLGSYEAVRSVLNFFVYYLAVEPEMQERILTEIQEMLVIEGQKPIGYESVAELHYLTACIMESMRLQPGFFRPDRKCTQDWEHNGIRIQKDTIVIFPIWAIHRDPDSYEDSHRFNPERFMPGRKAALDPYAFSMFGHGPRACIAQRFSIELLKIIMVHFVRNFRIERRHDTQLTYTPGHTHFLQTKPIYVNFVKR